MADSHAPSATSPRSLERTERSPRFRSHTRIAVPVAMEREKTAVVSVRGTAITPVQPFIETYFGAFEWPRYLSLISAGAREMFDRPVSPIGWYPFAFGLDMVDGLVRLADGRPRVLRDFAAFNLDFATNAIFRAIFKLGTPEFMVGRSDQVWKRFYSHGRMVCGVSPGQASVRLHDFSYLTANYNKLVGHSIEAVLNKAGAKFTRMRQPMSTLSGDRHTQFDFDWQ